jgi:hypothetical protein
MRKYKYIAYVKTEDGEVLERVTAESMEMLEAQLYHLEDAVDIDTNIIEKELEEWEVEMILKRKIK